MIKRIFPHVFVLLTFCLTFSLGYWQVERMQWKNALLQKIDERSNAAPINISEYEDIENDEFRLVKLKGEYLHDKEVIMLNRSYNSKAGTHIFTPIKTDSGIYFINRGWVKDEAEYNKPEGKVEVQGLIRKSQFANWISVENTPSKGQWFWVELAEMYKSVGLEPKEFYIDRKLEDESKEYPLALPKKIHVHNEHLQYTITWFSISIILLLVYYFRFWYKRGDENK